MDPVTTSAKPPKITIEKAAKHLPPATLGKPYNCQLLCDASDAKFLAGPLGGGFSIDADGLVTGTAVGLGPHRFEIKAESPTRGVAWGTFAISASPPTGRQASIGAPAGIPLEQVQAMIREALASSEAQTEQRIQEAVAAALAAKEP